MSRLYVELVFEISDALDFLNPAVFEYPIFEWDYKRFGLSIKINYEKGVLEIKVTDKVRFNRDGVRKPLAKVVRITSLHRFMILVGNKKCQNGALSISNDLAASIK